MWPATTPCSAVAARITEPSFEDISMRGTSRRDTHEGRRPCGLAIRPRHELTGRRAARQLMRTGEDASEKAKRGSEISEPLFLNQRRGFGSRATSVPPASRVNAILAGQVACGFLVAPGPQGDGQRPSGRPNCPAGRRCPAFSGRPHRRLFSSRRCAGSFRH